jgi:hypothetical protein
MLQYNSRGENGEMSTLLQEKAYLTDILGKDEVQAIPCAVLFSNGQEIKLWVGVFGDTMTFEDRAAKGEIYIIRFVVGASEVDYWSRKMPVIEMQWRRDDKWREWIKSSLSTSMKFPA